MESLALCGPTAFRYYRTPPQILGLYPPVPSEFEDSNHLKRSVSPLVTDILRAPLHRFSPTRRAQKKSKLYRTHAYAGELPFGCFQDTDHGFSVSSPLFTLLTLAPLVSRVHLLMAMYELCGSFAVFKPSPQMELILAEAQRQGTLPLEFGWKRVVATDGAKTDLWKRDPLIEMEELHAFASKIEGWHGAKAFRWAAERITGVCASPFEVQASILIGLPRRNGGMGLTVKNNVRIPLSEYARALYPHSCCYADLYLESDSGCPPVDIECQSRSVHDSEQAGLSDSDRIAAIESMGIQVVPLTFSQFSVTHSFEAVKRLLAKKLGFSLRQKTVAQQEVEQKLRAEVFIDWNTLASPAFEKPRHARSR